MQRLAVALTAVAFSVAAAAQSAYPAKFVRLVIPFPAGCWTSAFGLSPTYESYSSTISAPGGLA